MNTAPAKRAWQEPFSMASPPAWSWVLLIGLAVALRLALVVGSPTPYGYVYDLC